MLFVFGQQFLFKLGKDVHGEGFMVTLGFGGEKVLHIVL